MALEKLEAAMVQYRDFLQKAKGKIVGGGQTLDHFAGQMTAWPAVVDGGRTFRACVARRKSFAGSLTGLQRSV